MKVKLNAVTEPCNDMSVEQYLIYCARVSSQDRINHDTAPKLLNYLIRQGHWSPFEMINISLEITTSRAIAQQILRHRSFSFQEFSQRYSKVSKMELVNLRMQAKTNRQSSTDDCTDIKLKNKVTSHLMASHILYEELIDAGIAKECARMVLPLTTQTNIVMNGTLRSWIHFFSQRCNKHAQKEIQDVAYECRALVAEACPWTAAALDWT